MKKAAVQAFLEKHELAAARIDFEQETALFLENLRHGLKTEHTSMHMLPSYIEVGKSLPVGETVIVMDAGGTNLRVAALTFNERYEAIVEHFAMYPMPGTKGPVSKQAFFDTLVKYLEPVLPLSRKIGLCFSFATEMYPNRDGRPLAFSKEVELPEVEGELIGENLKLALREKGYREEIGIVLLNDTVAALLGGMSLLGKREISSYVGFILGTGTNTAYVEKNARILKVSGLDPEKSMIMNTESGTYPIANRSPIDKAIDAQTQIPGDHLFEKLLSGRYKGTQLYYTLKAAVAEGLFSEGFARGLSSIQDLEAKELSRFLKQSYGQGLLAGFCQNEDDREVLYLLIDNLEERAARLVIVNFAAILEQLNCGKNPLAPVAMTIDGSTYFKSPLLKAKVEYYVHAYLKDELGYYLELVPSDNSNLVGAAIAALTNL